MGHPPPLHLPDYVGPAVGALAFVAVMSLIREPARLKLNAMLATGASGVYLSGGFGPFELLYPLAVGAVLYRAFGSHRFIGIAWLLHAGWDAAHHLWGNAIWPFMPTSSFGCLIFDALIALWFLAGAPSVIHLFWGGRALSGSSGQAWRG
jgi:hypothetical protein